MKYLNKFQFFYLLTCAYALNLFDAVATYLFLGVGFSEANPFMRWVILSLGMGWFFSYKIFVAGAALYVLYLYQEHKYAQWGAYGVTLAYIVLTIHHFVLAGIYYAI